MSTGVTHARVTEEALSLERLAQLVGRAAAGAIVTF
jgi:molybdopterin synthase catalytic subunit